MKRIKTQQEIEAILRSLTGETRLLMSFQVLSLRRGNKSLKMLQNPTGGLMKGEQGAHMRAFGSVIHHFQRGDGLIKYSV